MAATDPEFAPGHDAVASDFYELGDLLRCSLAASLAKPAKQPAARKTTSISVRNREEVLRYANVLLVTFREVLEYDPRLHHNQTAPILRIEDPRYLEDVRAIVKHLTEFTAAIHNSTGAKSSVRKTDLLTRLLTSFVNSYAKSLGKVLAGLTGAAIVGFLYQAGVGKGVVEGIWAHLKLLK
jgi:hypothetical protein